MAISHFPKFTIVVREESGEENETHCLLLEEEEESEPEPRGCLLLFPCFGSTREALAGGGAATSWAAKRAASLRESSSEVAAEPKWRKLGGLFAKKKKKKKKKGGFRYDSWEYALNFDDGLVNDGEEEEERFLRRFSVRFAPPVHQDNKAHKLNVASSMY